MTSTRITVFVIYAIAVLVAYVLKQIVRKMAEKAIKEKRLSTGIYRIIPVEGDQAVRLAKGYIFGVNIFFWFVIFIFPFMIIVSIKLGAL